MTNASNRADADASEEAEQTHMRKKQARNPEFQRLFAWLGLVLGAIVTVFLVITLLFAKNPAVGIILTVFFAGVTVVCGIGVARLRQH